ncbi:hypothetical protein Brms1b_003986 [Colletotrichum noveboracense]|nr:hypothetical protein Brms1b_003986 [Colletotrichum noveboracense]
MPIDVQPIVAADLRRCAEIEHDAFAESPSYPVLFPGPLPDDPLALRVEGLEKELREDPTVRFLKAVDTELQGDEAIVAWAKFNSYPEGLPVPKPRVPPPGSNAEACTALFVGIDKMRERLMTGKPCVFWARNASSKLGDDLGAAEPEVPMRSQEGHDLVGERQFAWGVSRRARRITAVSQMAEEGFIADDLMDRR